MIKKQAILDLSVEQLYEYLSNRDVLCLISFNIEGVKTLYKAPMFTNIEDMIEWIARGKLTRKIPGVSSGDYYIYDAEFLIVYPK